MHMVDEQRAILTRAAEQEAARQSAVARRDAHGVAAAERELRALWRRFAMLDEQARIARTNDGRGGVTG